MCMKLLFTLVAVTTAAPQGYGPPPAPSPGYSSPGGAGGGFRGASSGPVVPILKDDRQGPIDGVYAFDFETGDGISRQEQGAPTGPGGAVVQQGGWSFTFPDGTSADFKFVADENGFHVESPLLPTPPPLPQHAIDQIEKARREDAANAAGGRGAGGYSAPSAPAPQYSSPPRSSPPRSSAPPARPSSSYGLP